MRPEITFNHISTSFTYNHFRKVRDTFTVTNRYGASPQMIDYVVGIFQTARDLLKSGNYTGVTDDNDLPDWEVEPKQESRVNLYGDLIVNGVLPFGIPVSLNICTEYTTVQDIILSAVNTARGIAASGVYGGDLVPYDNIPTMPDYIPGPMYHAGEVQAQKDDAGAVDFDSPEPPQQQTDGSLPQKDKTPPQPTSDPQDDGTIREYDSPDDPYMRKWVEAAKGGEILRVPVWKITKAQTQSGKTVINFLGYDRHGSPSDNARVDEFSTWPPANKPNHVKWDGFKDIYRILGDLPEATGRWLVEAEAKNSDGRIFWNVTHIAEIVS